MHIKLDFGPRTLALVFLDQGSQSVLLLISITWKFVRTVAPRALSQTALNQKLLECIAVCFNKSPSDSSAHTHLRTIILDCHFRVHMGKIEIYLLIVCLRIFS